MRTWIRDGVRNLVSAASEKGIGVVGIPTNEPSLFEALIFGELTLSAVNRGYSLVGGVLELGLTNMLPYRRVTQGSQIGDRVPPVSLERWAAPVAVLRRRERTLSLFRQGCPLLRGRDRPDLLMYSAEFSTRTFNHKLMGNLLEVRWSGKDSGRRIYSTLCDPNGPVCRQQEGTLIHANTGVEISLNKTSKRLADQFATLSKAGCQHIYAILANEMDINGKVFPDNAAVFTVTSTHMISESISEFEIWRG